MVFKPVGIDENGLFAPRAEDALVSGFPLGPTSFLKRAQYQPLSTFQVGHGWTATSGATPFAEDTVDYIFGSQSLKGVTAGTGTAVIMSSVGRPAADFTNKTIAVLLKVSDIEKFDGAYLLMGTGNFAAFRSVQLAKYKGTGASALAWSNEYQWYHAEISETNGITGTPNMAAITDLRLQVYDRNTGALTVNLQAIATYERQTTYPNGVASFTWDDNYLPQFELAQKRVFDKWGDGCTYYIIWDTLGITQPGSGPRFTLAQAHELETMHNSEISAHAYTGDQHNDSINTTPAELDKALAKLKRALRKEGFRGADGYCWPQGNNTPEKAKIVAKYFSHARHTGGDNAPLVPNMPYRYQAITLSSDTTLAQYKTKIDFAKLHGLHIVFMGHQVKDSGATGSTNINLTDLDAVVSYVHEVGMPVRTMGEVFRTMNPPTAEERVLVSPDKSRFQLTVGNDGALITTKL